LITAWPGPRQPGAQVMGEGSQSPDFPPV